MVNTLKNNLRKLFEESRQRVSVYEFRDRIVLLLDDKTNSEDLIQLIVSKVSGISSISAALVINSSKDEIITRGVLEAKKILPPNSCSYAVRAKREGNHPFSSISIASDLGSAIGKSGIKGLKVNLSNPDFTIFLDIRNELTFIYSEVEYGIDGIPSQTQGTAVAIFRPHVNSILAAWLMKKRGVEIIPIFFKTGKTTENDFITVIEKIFSPIHSFIDLNKFHNIFKDEEDLCFYCQAYCETISQKLAQKAGINTFISPTCFNFEGENTTIRALRILETSININSLRPIQFGFLGKNPNLDKVDRKACCSLRKKVSISVSNSINERKLQDFLKMKDCTDNH
jgi:thiamine biosynthesis protein ThiI